jgi:hypothetical protein
VKLKHPQYMESAWRNRPDTKVNGYFQLADNAVVSYNATQVTFTTSVGAAGEVIIAPHGTLYIGGDGGRDPDWRHEMSCLFGVDFDLAKEFAGKLFCPHTKQKVQVSRIVDNTALWCDREHGVALVAGCMSYASPDAPPVRKTVKQINYSFVNRKRTKEFTARWKKLVNEAKMRMPMMGTMSAGGLGLIPLLDELVKNADVVDIESAVRISQSLKNAAQDELVRTYQVCRTLTSNAERSDLNELISFACADHYQSPYLEYRP